MEEVDFDDDDPSEEDLELVELGVGDREDMPACEEPESEEGEEEEEEEEVKKLPPRMSNGCRVDCWWPSAAAPAPAPTPAAADKASADRSLQPRTSSSSAVEELPAPRSSTSERILERKQADRSKEKESY